MSTHLTSTLAETRIDDVIPLLIAVGIQIDAIKETLKSAKAVFHRAADTEEKSNER